MEKGKNREKDFLDDWSTLEAISILENREGTLEGTSPVKVGGLLPFILTRINIKLKPRENRGGRATYPRSSNRF